MSALAKQISVDDIFTVGDRRPVDEHAVGALIESISKIGLQTPITVRGDDSFPDPETGEVMGAYVLVAGAHRLEAFRRMGRNDIPAVVMDCDEIDAEMWEISENLHRADLSKDERDRCIRRFAELIERREARDVQSKQNAAIESKREDGRGHRPKGTARKVAEETGVSVDTVRRALNPPPPKPPKVIEPKSDEDAYDEWEASMMRLWNRAAPEWRQRFLDAVDIPVMDKGQAA